MDSAGVDEVLSELSDACESATTTDEVVSAALPALLGVSGARTVLVLDPHDKGSLLTFAGSAGEPDLPDGLDLGTVADTLTEVPVPAAWADRGIGRVAARVLPGAAGTLVLLWPEKVTASPWFPLALGVVSGALARVRAQDDLRDLTVRVDNAQLLANMGDYDWEIASDTNRWSDQLYRIYGHPPQSFNASYERFLGHVHPDDRERIQAIHQEAYASGEPYQMIERIVRPDGELRYLSSNGQVLMNSQNAPARMRGTCVDITDRVLAEAERERMSARFRSLVECGPQAMMVLDNAGHILQANTRSHDLLGGDPSGHSIDEILPASTASGLGVEASGLDGRDLRLDVAVGELNAADGQDLMAIFLIDAAPRLASEALAATLREAQVRRKQALEINDNVVQGLTASVLALGQDDASAAMTLLDKTLTAARQMMNDLLDPLTGRELEPGDLVRSSPSKLESTPEVVKPPTPEPGQRGARRRILIVDDSADIRTLLRAQLELVPSLEVVGEAANGEEAVYLARELKPNLVLLDLAMPRMDGLTALPLIQEAVEGVRVIVLSGFDAGSMAEKALAAGAARYIEKGLRMNLADVIDEVLNT